MTGMPDMEYSIWVEEVSLASDILFKKEDQEILGWVGLSLEVKEICRETGLSDPTTEGGAGRHHHVQPGEGQGRDACQGPQEARGDGQDGLQVEAGLNVQYLPLRQEA